MKDEGGKGGGERIGVMRHWTRLFRCLSTRFYMMSVMTYHCHPVPARRLLAVASDSLIGLSFLLLSVSHAATSSNRHDFYGKIQKFSNFHCDLSHLTLKKKTKRNGLILGYRSSTVTRLAKTSSGTMKCIVYRRN